MTEQLIGFETAKLAKEKGFNIPNIRTIYNKDGEEGEYLWDMKEGYLRDLKDNYLRVNQSLLQKWLREVHDIVVIVVPVINTTRYAPIVYTNKAIKVLFEEKNSVDHISYKTYETALEKGLVESLKLIL